VTKEKLREYLANLNLDYYTESELAKKIDSCISELEGIVADHYKED
jgi:hypothetical protein